MTAVLIQNEARTAGAWVHMRRPGFLVAEGLLDGDEVVIAMRGEDQRRMKPLMIREDGEYPLLESVRLVQAYRADNAGGGRVNVKIRYGQAKAS